MAVQFLTVILPVASELDAGQDRARLRTLYITASRLALATVAPAAVVLIVLGSVILRVWVGPDFAEHAPLVTVLAVAVLLATSQRPAVEILLGMAQHRVVAVTSVAAGAANIVLSILLLPLLGLLGVAVGTLVPSAIAAFCVVMPFAQRQLRISLRTALQDVWAPALVPAVPAMALLWELQRHVAAPDVPVLLAWIVATVAVYAAGYLSMPATTAERRLVRDGVTGGSRYLWRLVPRVSRLI